MATAPGRTESRGCMPGLVICDLESLTHSTWWMQDPSIVRPWKHYGKHSLRAEDLDHLDSVPLIVAPERPALFQSVLTEGTIRLI